MDEWVMERYDLAKERVSEIPQETTAAEPYRDFFVREAAFLQKITAVMDHGTAGKTLEELQKQNHELYQDILPENYDILTEILLMHRRCWENTERHLLSCTQNFTERLLTLLRKKRGI